MSKVVPEGWKLLELDDVTDKILGGGTPSRLGPSYWNGDIPWVSVKDLSGIRLTDTEESITSEGLANSASRLIPENTAILATRMAVGKLAYFDRAVAINQDLKAFFPKKNLDWKFFLQWYLSKSETIAGLATGSTVKGIRLEDLRRLPIKLPPFAEQQKIATILSSVDNVIEKTRTQIDKLKDLKTGMMQELLTKGIGHTEFKDSPVERIPKAWDVKEFNQIFTFKNGVNKGKESFGHGVPIISYRNVYDGGGIDDAHIENLVEMTDAELPRFKCNYGDVFFTRTSETQHEIGYGNVYLGKRDDVVYSGFVIRARQTNQFLHAEYCKYAFQSHSIRKQMICNSKYTTRAGIGSEGLACLKIGIPPIKEQQKIVNVLQSIDTKIIAANQKLISVEQTKKALMQDLLAGNVRV